MMISNRVKSLLKISIGFYTLVGCMDFTFGVPWPAEFSSFLTALQLLALDMNVLSAFFCQTAGFNYYDSLLGSTMLALGVVLCIGARFRVLGKQAEEANQQNLVLKKEKLEKKCRSMKKAVFYIGVFLYPVLNLNVFQIFVCQTVSENSYLRSDYSVECLTAQWRGYAAYCSLWILTYTIGFPVGLWVFLHRNHETIIEHYDDLLSPFYKEVGFLWNDYRAEFYWWECTELVRKLVLSSCLLLMSQGSPWQVAGAALFSMWSHLLFTHCRPMKDPRAHALQHIGLGLTTLNYFVGLMLKVQAIKGSTLAGPLMILLNLTMVVAVTVAVLYRGTKMELSVARRDEKKHLEEQGMVEQGLEEHATAEQGPGPDAGLAQGVDGHGGGGGGGGGGAFQPTGASHAVAAGAGVGRWGGAGVQRIRVEVGCLLQTARHWRVEWCRRWGRGAPAQHTQHTQHAQHARGDTPEIQSTLHREVSELSMQLQTMLRNPMYATTRAKIPRPLLPALPLPPGGGACGGGGASGSGAMAAAGAESESGSEGCVGGCGRRASL
jgi:hypothetical protein